MTAGGKTQNVSVDHNVFDFNAAEVSRSCNPATGCGYQGVFSQYGTFPSWSPYKKTVVEQSITFNQNNHFSDNKYAGAWQFVIHQQGNDVSWQVWTSAPYQQDQGSSASAATKG